MDPLILSRIQFGANISFHILFPTITIALGWVLLFFKLRYNATSDGAWMRAYFTWVKVFALSFAMGVVTGVTMSFQFGTNWPGYMETVGNVAGPLLAYEILTAFFLEAAFLGIMLFGFRRVSNRIHTLATVLVAGGTTVSAFWIIALNSWMQTPTGFEMRDGVAHAVDWWAIVFNPSMPYRLVHMLLASGLTVSFFIAGLSALRYLQGDRSQSMWKALRTGTFLAAVLIPIQIFAGDQHGLNTLEHQPAKIAAMEANWHTGPNIPLVLFALPDEKAKENRFEITIPDGASLILRHSADGVVPGLDQFEGNHPPVFPVFWGFRIMVGIGLLMLAVSWAATFFLWRRKSLPRPLALLMVPMTVSGWVATLAGWYTTEIGRQPWLVTGVLKTADAVGPVAGSHVALTLAIYLILYAVLLVAFLGVLVHLALKAAKEGDTSPLPGVMNAALSQPAQSER
ncbi:MULTISPECIES: cytochrome ubiquinol oxidase subunit I [unclassified Mesorhizobium]|uniref:cytochrome ubiquinol oxidase subunit I n=1 Tax=unclassified Mesorhizobium TaxID=325217 RepID=UPI0006FFE4BC|nr:MULTISPECIES: cytochrome ubiquinol oxidase subunit I [unclassified Mesorhizobium]KQZ12748.1 cytochrome D ubiquinol oxidase subunit I [Mesorhizobium sp. Root1471]KQZ35270.1 cytochrome D ubiquinol oxidase subunit I [Mesorhizobium sp. Root554]MDR7031503.1 cytochrome d ubiquinol oxidase subunit I [Mesorhizobium sp. BE184]